MKTPTPAPDAHNQVQSSAAPQPPETPRYDPRLLAAVLNVLAAAIRWLDHHMGGGWLL